MRYTRRAIAFSALCCLSLTCSAQPIARANLANVLNFESQQTAGALRSWGGGPSGTLFADNQTVHGGKWSARLERNASSQNDFSTITLGIPIDFKGDRVELRGFLKLEDVSSFAGLWLREDGEGSAVAFDNMQNRALKGTSDWKEYSIVLPLRPEATMLVFGVLQSGTGKTWADDLQLLVDGKPIWDVPTIEKPKTALDLDHEFDAGSRFAPASLSRAQVENLTTLGKVWGFLKYHHPGIVAGQHHWDYDLFRELPKILAAHDGVEAAAETRRWIASLGTVEDCGRCQDLKPDGLQLAPDVSWISNEKLLGSDLSRELQRIYRTHAGNKFYVWLMPGVGNPVFDHEPTYPGIRVPDAGYQLLALYRFWNIIEYWYPNRNIVGEDWSGVLTDFIPRIALATDAQAYKREMMELIGMVHDTHANLWGSLESRPPVGDCQLPVVMRFVEGSAVVAGYSDAANAEPELRIGDIVTDLDGTPVSELISRWRPYYADSNEAARLRDIAQYMTQGACGTATLRLRRDSDTMTISTPRVPSRTLNAQAGRTHDRAGETFQKLSADVAYIKLSSVKAADAARYVDEATGAKGLIIDIRNYPSEFVVFALGQLLVDKPTDFARFTVGDLENPGAFHWGTPLTLTPLRPHFGGKVVILVDEVSLSSAEYTAMAFRSAPGAIVIGSTTAGADGNTSPIPLPGGLRTLISGIGVFYPDKTPTQQVGIVPNIEVKPTIAGIRAGRDEVLEAALRQVLGADIPDAQIQAMAASNIH